MSAGVVRVLGVDPGLASVGWGVVDTDGVHLFYRGHGCISTLANRDMSDRLATIRDGLLAVADEYAPAEVAMEGLFFSRNVTSALKVSEVRGVIRLAFRDRGIALSEYLPNAVKQASAGSASAGKADVQAFIKMVLGLKTVPKPDHAADALAVAVCHCQNRGWQVNVLPDASGR
ncbi:MAG: crossover junction endodeoxyribonuclease RuvC [Spirochaetales bacterium]|nr:MAG: crossover junction endodeoxyribonuclease RuvC [Spirochaetales bacterium]